MTKESKKSKSEAARENILKGERLRKYNFPLRKITVEASNPREALELLDKKDTLNFNQKSDD